jgi:hypothetical protein
MRTAKRIVVLLVLLLGAAVMSWSQMPIARTDINPANWQPNYLVVWFLGVMCWWAVLLFFWIGVTRK